MAEPGDGQPVDEQLNSLQLRKMRAEVNAAEHPWRLNPTTWVAAVAVVGTLATSGVQWVRGEWAAERGQRALDLAKIDRDRTQLELERLAKIKLQEESVLVARRHASLLATVRIVADSARLDSLQRAIGFAQRTYAQQPNLRGPAADSARQALANARAQLRRLIRDNEAAARDAEQTRGRIAMLKAQISTSVVLDTVPAWILLGTRSRLGRGLSDAPFDGIPRVGSIVCVTISSESKSVPHKYERLPTPTENRLPIPSARGRYPTWAFLRVLAVDSVVYPPRAGDDDLTIGTGVFARVKEVWRGDIDTGCSTEPGHAPDFIVREAGRP